MKRVLILDDDDDLRAVLVTKFLETGWAAEFAASGNAGFERIENETFDLVVSDIRMPNGTGIELLRKLKRRAVDHKVNPPVIIMTGLLEGGRPYLMSLGASEVFVKPASFEDLLVMAERLVNEPNSKSNDSGSKNEPSGSNNKIT